MPDNGNLSFEERMARRDVRKAALKSAGEQRKQADMIKLDELEQEHGDDNVMPVWTSAGLVVIKRPKRIHATQFQQAVIKDGKPEGKAQRQVDALERLARQSLLYPDFETYDAMVTDYPGIASKVGGAAARFAELASEEEEGK